MQRTVLATATLSMSMLASGVVLGQDNDKHVFVTALDKDGTPVVGLTTEHFAVRESGRDRTVIKVEPLRTPMHVAVLVDTSVASGTPDEPFRSAVVAFIERLAATNHVALYAFGDRATRVAAFTQDPVQLRSAATGMFGWSHQRTNLIDAVDLALGDFVSVEPPRPVIIAISSENAEASGRTAGAVIRRLIAQSVAFHAVTIATLPANATTGVGTDIPTKSQRLGGMIAAGEGDRERTQMLQQGTTITGGGRQRVTSTLALAGALGRVANELSNSFKVTFTRPGTARMQDLQVGILVDGVTLRATAAPFGTK
jgi:VWFA-related protein